MLVRLKPNSLFYQIALVLMILCAFLFRIDVAHANDDKAAQQHMGQVLFAFYQGDHYGALLQQQLYDNRLLSEEQQQQMALLRGGLSLSYGLTQQSQQIFEELLDQQSTRSTQAMAWFWLGKIHYQQHDYTNAQEAFAQLKPKNVHKKLEKNQAQELAYMQAQISMYLGDADMEKHLDSLEKQSVYRAYINFNRGVDLLDSDEREQGLLWLQEAYQTPNKAINRGWFSRWFVSNEEELLSEHQALNDRIQLALGYGFMQADKPEKAVSAFTKVHDDSLDTHAALLGYGWALAQQKDFEKALAVWRQLMKQPNAGLYGYEAMLASAYAFEQVDANTQALSMLNEAQSQYEKRLLDITNIHENVTKDAYFQPFIERLSLRYSIKKEGRFSAPESAEALPNWIDNGMAIQLWSQPETNTLIQQLIEVQQQTEQLKQWEQDIANFHLLINEREVEATNRNEQLQTQDFEQQLQRLSEQVRVLNERVIRAEQEESPSLLADEQSLTHQKRLDKALATYDYLISKKDLKPAYAQRLERLQGLISWTLSEAFSNNLWQSKKRLSEVRGLLAEAENNKERLLSAMDRRANFALKRQNIDNLSAQLEEQFKSAESLKQKLLDKLVDKNSVFLANESSQLQQYLYQAKLSKLRLQDKAYAAKERLELSGTSVQDPRSSVSSTKASRADTQKLGVE